MAIYELELDGQRFEIDGPDGASEDELYAAAVEHQKAGGTPQESNPPAESGYQVDPLVSPLGALGQAAQKGFDALGRGVAETLSSGISPKNVPGLPIPMGASTPGAGARVKPEIAAGIGTAIQMAPDIASSAFPIGNAKAVGNAAKSVIPRILRASKKEAGEAIGAVERAAGARLPRKTETLPKVGRTADKARLELDKISRTLERFAEKGQEPTGRYLTRTQDRLKLILDKFNKSNAGKDQLGQDAVVKASQLKEDIVRTLNEQIPTRVEPAMDYAAAIKREEILKSLGKAAKTVATVGPVAALTGYGAAKFFGGK